MLRTLLNATLLPIALCVTSCQTAPRHVAGLESVECIWREAPHNAFTDLLVVNDRLLCTFREGDDHVHGRDGTIQVIEHTHDGTWNSVAQLQEDGVDLRDPKLSLTPDGRVMLTCGGSVYVDRQLQSMTTRVAFADPDTMDFSPPAPIVVDEAIASDRDWLWRVTWHDGTGWGVLYQPFDETPEAHLVKTTDGIQYQHAMRLPVDGAPNEVTLRFRDDTMHALARRGGGDQLAMFGHAPPPWSNWTFTKLDERIGGPNFVDLDGEWVVAGRRYLPDEQRTFLATLDDAGAMTTLEVLPSGGDTSYPGLIVDDDRLLVSYYSSHEGQTAIYLATFNLD